MDKAAQEAERQGPGVCHHEAAHAVFAHHAKAPIDYVVVGEDSEAMSFVRYRRGDVLATSLIVAGVLAGRYAEELAATGKEREHVPFERLRESFEEALRTDKAPEGFEADEMQAFSMVMTLDKAQREGAYRGACAFAAEHVGLWWDEIDALAGRLLEAGRLEGAEVARVIQAVGQDGGARA